MNEQIKKAIEFLESKKKKYDRNDPCVGCNRDFGCGSCHYVSTYRGNKEHRENYKNNSTYEEYVANEYNLNYDLAIQALQSELDRQENKALTLSELKEIVGEPVYSNHSSCYRIIKSVDDFNKSVFFTDNQNGWWETFKENRFYKHKPTEGV